RLWRIKNKTPYISTRKGQRALMFHILLRSRGEGLAKRKSMKAIYSLAGISPLIHPGSLP
ncbi:MAG: hypothetical protein DRH11_00730, partial [Deltaproteobacteria bacterium]